MAAFYRLRLPGVRLQGCKRTLEESIVDHVGFAVLAVYNPVAFRHFSEAGVGGNGFGVVALCGIDKQRSKRTKCTHGPPLAPWPISLLEDFFHKKCDVELLGICKGGGRAGHKRSTQRLGGRSRSLRAYLPSALHIYCGYVHEDTRMSNPLNMGLGL